MEDALITVARAILGAAATETVVAATVAATMVVAITEMAVARVRTQGGTTEIVRVPREITDHTVSIQATAEKRVDIASE